MIIFKATTVAFFFLFATLEGKAADVHVRPTGLELDISRFSLTFEDLFKKPDVVGQGPFSGHVPGMRWIAHTPWNGDFGSARFADPGPNTPFTFGDTGLQIRASKDQDGKWQSGLICSVDRDGPSQQGFSQRSGYFEIRTRLPEGPGTWPAFWLVGIDKTLGSAEIDVLEYYGQFRDSFRSTLHLWRDGDMLKDGYVVTVDEGSLTKSFHNYGVLITDEDMTFYFDRKEYLRLPTPALFKQPMYMIADLALGGGWPIEKLQSPATMLIEYIRVYQIQPLG